MRFDPDRHRRRSVRLKGYDYAEPGAYFVTLCTRDRACLFGHVVNGEMRLNDAGGSPNVVGRISQPISPVRYWMQW